ncbi:MAG: hypothetical protein PHO10_00060 [Gemmiger sp.]|nr:hypothetical protein [Gemmiger sp.]
MNQLYRALHMPPGRLLKKLTGSKEIYTIAVRRRDPEQPLPALGKGCYTPLPYDPTTWYADPLLYNHRGRRALFCEAFDCAAAKGRIAVFDFDENGLLVNPRVILEEPHHLSFPMVFAWGGALYMVPESGAIHTLDLYRCDAYPEKWSRVARFDVGCELCDTIVWAKGEGGVCLLGSETKPENQLYTRYRRYILRREGDAFALEPDDAFNTAHLDFSLTDRNAGPLLCWGGQHIHPTQVSTTVDYGVYLQFFGLEKGRAHPICAAQPNLVEIAGLDNRDIIGIHTYCCDEEWEIIDARYLHRPPPRPRPAPGNEAPPVEAGEIGAPGEAEQAGEAGETDEAGAVAPIGEIGAPDKVGKMGEIGEAGENAQPAQRQEPAKTEAPGQAEKADEPGKAGEKREPDEPGKAGKPEKPGEPEKPEKPGKPEKAAKPEKPGKPEKSAGKAVKQ